MNKGKKQVSQLSFLVNFLNDKGSCVKDLIASPCEKLVGGIYK
ncbi:hypothetical protein ACT7CU_05855 [Bacillus paranthracis]